MKTPHTLTTGLVLGLLALSGCSNEVTEPEPVETEAIETERNFNASDPCALFTGDELSAAIGVAEFGAATEVDSNIQQTLRPHCDWAVPEGARAALNIVESVAGDKAEIAMRLERFEIPSSCFGTPCDTPEEFVEAWSVDRMAWLAQGQQFEGQFELVSNPDWLAGAAAAGSQGIIFLDDEIIAYITIYACESPECARAVIGMQEALTQKLG